MTAKAVKLEFKIEAGPQNVIVAGHSVLRLRQFRQCHVDLAV